MPKRKLSDNPDLVQFESELQELLHDIRGHGLDRAATAILDLAHEAGVTLRELKKYQAGVPSFSNASWNDVAPKFNLDPSKDVLQLRTFSVPVASLPPSFHREVMNVSAKWLDVYRERGAHDREAVRVRLMDAWHVPVCALFKGRLVDKPEFPTPETPETFGGEVEHIVYMTEGIILLVFELKLYLKDERDHIAQVLLELASAYQLNRNKDFRPQPPVYALLTDLRIFYFIRYDGSEFTRMDTMYVPDLRPEFLAGMIKVSEHLFSILLEGYIGTLAAVEARSDRRETIKKKPSHGKWTQALAHAREAQTILVRCSGELLDSGVSLDLWESIGSRGLKCLDDSIRLLSKIGSVTDWDAIELNDESEKVLLGHKRVLASRR